MEPLKKTRYIAVQHESLAIEADSPEEALREFMRWLNNMDVYSITIYDEATQEDVTP